MKKIVLCLIFLCVIFGTASATPGIDADVTDGSAPLTVQFSSDTKHTNITDYNWYFGDGTVSHEQNPSHTFTNPGMYSVKLEVCFMKSTGKIAIDGNTKTAYIKVGEYADKKLSVSEAWEHANKTKREWANMTWVESSTSPASLKSQSATETPTEAPLLKTQSVETDLVSSSMVEKAIAAEITTTATPTPTNTPEPESTYDAKAEIEKLKEENEALKAEVEEQGDLLMKIWKWVSALMGAPQ